MEKYYAAYLLLMNLIAFCLMGWDKRLARRGAWRVPERTLFFAAAIGGAPGGLLAMWMFRHKTRHWYFVLGFSLLAAAQAALSALLLL